ncbi:MAG: hypothetical protein ACI86H_000389 [bacterium]|jgi:hypothetical protein
MTEKLSFKYGDLNYQKVAEGKSPFAKRDISPKKQDSSNEKAKILTTKENFYDWVFANQASIYTKRSQYSSNKTKSFSQKKNFLTLNKLIPNPREQDISIRHFIHELLERWEENPEELFIDADRLRSDCKLVGYEIPKYDSFKNLTTWDELINLINSIKDGNFEGKFELLTAAITQYADLCRAGASSD